MVADRTSIDPHMETTVYSFKSDSQSSQADGTEKVRRYVPAGFSVGTCGGQTGKGNITFDCQTLEVAIDLVH